MKSQGYLLCAALLGCSLPTVKADVVNTNLFAVPVVIKKLLLTAVLPLHVAVNCLVPTKLMLRLLKVATPLGLVACDVVPDSVPVPELSVIATEAPETAAPIRSVTVAVTGGAIEVVAAASVGCCPNATAFTV